MKDDSQGFKYPAVSNLKCINCGLCLKVCPYSKETNLTAKKYYAVKHADSSDQQSSTSGGFASALSEYIISSHGIVYGVVETEDFLIKTVRASSYDEILRFKGSKYVQSDLNETFNQAADDLNNGRLVAFFASSCHIDGLQKFLKTKKVTTDNLVTIDFICHGVPSPKVFSSYINFLKKRKDITEYLFRTKTKGWGKGSILFCPSINYKRNGKIYSEVDSNLARAWLSLFFSNNCLRPHCYSCPYAGKGRSADFTMADFWGLQNSHPDFFDENGVSLVICNTAKSINYFSTLKNLIFIPSEFSEASKKQSNMHAPSPKGAKYDKFWSDYCAKDFSYIMRHYTPYNPLSRIKKLIKRFLHLL